METVADGLRVPEQADEAAGEVAAVGEDPQGSAVAVHDDGGAAAHPVHGGPLAEQRHARRIVGVRRAHDRGGEAPLAVGRDEQLLARDLSREYCQNGLRSGVDSVIGRRAGGVWYADAEEMNTYWPVRPRRVRCRAARARG